MSETAGQEKDIQILSAQEGVSVRSALQEKILYIAGIGHRAGRYSAHPPLADTDNHQTAGFPGRQKPLPPG